MSTYRIDGIKYNPANWAGLDPSERAACNRFAAARERELNTITATPHTCNGGPFAGSVIELESTTDRTAPMAVGGWVGHYELQYGGANMPEWQRRQQAGISDNVKTLRWVGNDAGAAVNTHGAATSNKAAPEITGKGFDQLRDLLAEMAEDPTEREEVTTSSAWADCKPGHVDDFGDEYTPRPRGAWAIYPVATVGRSKKKAYQVASDHQNGRNTPDDFGALVGITDRPAYRAEWLRIVRRARYTIGRTTYTVTATAAAVDKLRARLIKIKKWLSDKMLTAAGPGRTTEAIPDIAAAMAATLAIAQAQASAATAHQGDTAEACGELVTCDGPDGADTAEATPCADTPADLAHAIAEAHTPGADEPDHYTDPLKTCAQARDYTGPLKTQAPGVIRLRNGEDVLARATKYGMSAYTFSNRTQAQKAAENHGGEVIQRGRPFFVRMAPKDHAGTATPPANANGFAQIARSKTGAWIAALYRGAMGAHVLRFDALGLPTTWASHASRAELMASLQAMARQAEQAQAAATAPAGAQAHTPADPAPAAPEAHTPSADEPGHYTDPLKTQQHGNALEQAPAVVDFERAKPFSLDPRELLSAGLKVDQLVGLGVLYLGNAANASGEGAITEATDTRGQSFGGLNMVCTLEDGRVIKADPHSFTGELRPIFQFNGKMHGAPYLAQLAAVRASLKAQHSSAQAMAEAEHARQLETLAAEFPQLERPGKNQGGKLAAINMRKLLKQAFKGVKFSVTSDYNSARVRWEDGPTAEQVNAVIGRFDIGHSDCNSDYFYTTETAWSQLFGGVQYLTTSRSTSDTMVSSAIAQAFSGASLPEDASPKAWRNASGAFSWNTDSGQMYSRRVREILSKTPA